MREERGWRTGVHDYDGKNRKDAEHRLPTTLGISQEAYIFPTYLTSFMDPSLRIILDPWTE